MKRKPTKTVRPRVLSLAATRRATGGSEEIDLDDPTELNSVPDVFDAWGMRRVYFA